MVHTRIVVIEHGQFVIVRNAVGTEVTFESLEDFSRCTEMDFTDKYYVGYEPDIDFFEDSEDSGISNADIPMASYEWIIDNVATLIVRKEDVYFGVPVVEQAALAMETHKRIATENLQTALSIIRDHEDRVARGLTAILTPAQEIELTAYLMIMQTQVDTPSDNPAVLIADVPTL